MASKEVRIEMLRQLQRLPQLDDNVASNEDLDKIIAQIKKESGHE
jgi:hypothetical protein